MSESTPARQLPSSPSIENLKKQAKSLLKSVQGKDPEGLRRIEPYFKAESTAFTLQTAQLVLAREYGFSSWRSLTSEALAKSKKGAAILDAVRNGDAQAVEALLHEHPELLNASYGEHGQSLLHIAARQGPDPSMVRLLIKQGVRVNQRDIGDNAYPLHFAAELGHLDTVKALVEAGADVVGEGDLHAGGVLGWATNFGTVQQEVVDYLLAQGARCSIFSAIALGDLNLVKKMVEDDPERLTETLSEFENFRTPIEHAAVKNQPEIFRYLLGQSEGVRPELFDHAVFSGSDVSLLKDMVANQQKDHVCLAILERDWSRAKSFAEADPGILPLALLLLTHRGDVEGVTWLLDQGVDVNERVFCSLMDDAHVPALCLAAAKGNLDMIQLLLDRGADRSIKDTKYQGNAEGWAHHFGKTDAAGLLKQAS